MASSALSVFCARKCRSWMSAATAVAVITSNVMALVSNDHLSINVFFFQAEDGIRCLYVTGVQTCALPISEPAAVRARRDLEQPGAVAAGEPEVSSQRQQRLGGGGPDPLSPHDHDVLAGLPEGVARSEERRVGKECRCRQSTVE